MIRLHYPIKGMSCAACVAHVERAVKGALGEGDQFTVSLLTNSVTVLLNREEMNEKETEAFGARLAAAVKSAGYTLVTREEEPKQKGASEFQKALGRLIVSIVFTLAVMYLSMGGMMGLPIPLWFTRVPVRMVVAQLLLTLPVLLLNFKFFRSGCAALLHRSPNMDSLIAVGAGASVIYGLYALGSLLFAEEADPHWLHNLYFESAAMILTLVSLGKLLESRAKNRASDAIRSLATMAPKFATVLTEEGERTVCVEEIRVGDRLLVRAGEWIPVDGTVLEGRGSADESALTGESMPVEKEIGSTVRAACVLTSGALTVQAEQVGEDTSLSRILRLLEDAASSKAPIARIADRVSAVFVPCVMAISLVTFLVWMLVSQNLEMALKSAISVLVISCPCALGLATPTAITVGIGRGARMGILFRSAEALEKLCGVRTVVFDKTGTITEGNPSLCDLCVLGESPVRVLTLAAAVERLSSHPLAAAVARGAEELELKLPGVDEFSSLTGVGAEGRVEGIQCRVGKPNEEFFDEKNTYVVQKELSLEDSVAAFEGVGIEVKSAADLPALREAFTALEREGKTAVVVTLDGRPVGVLGISDRIREDSPNAVKALKSAGVTCLMFTGDNERTAAFVAQKANLDGYYASLMPEDKERMVRELSEQGACAMVGDGINDAPALVRADVGIAVGAGTEVAVDCAGVVLSGSSLAGVTEAYLLSRATIRIIKQNLFWALFYNAICIPVAAGVFYPLFHWQLSPMLASAAMSCSSVFVVLNALRLRKINLKGEKKMLFGFGKKEKTTCVHTVGVEGMMCQRCVAHVKDAITSLKGVTAVEVSLEEKKVTVTAAESLSVDAIKAAITKAGYQVI